MTEIEKIIPAGAKMMMKIDQFGAALTSAISYLEMNLNHFLRRIYDDDFSPRNLTYMISQIYWSNAYGEFLKNAPKMTQDWHDTCLYTRIYLIS